MERIIDELQKIGRTIVEIAGDGNCQFAAIADQLMRKRGTTMVLTAWDVRQAIASFIEENGNYFKDFLNGELHQYISEIRKNGVWGDNYTLKAAADLYKCSIKVISSIENNDVVIEPGNNNNNQKSLDQIVIAHIVEYHYHSSKLIEDTENELTFIEKRTGLDSLIERIHLYLKEPIEQLFSITYKETEDETDDRWTEKFKFWNSEIKPMMRLILDECDLARGKKIGFLGERGSGKSTLINSILGIDDFLPVDRAKSATASISELVSWDKLHYEILVYFISKEEWDIEKEKAQEDEEDSSSKSFFEKADVLGTNKDLGYNMPDKFQEEIKRGYKKISCQTVEEAKKYLNEYTYRSNQMWPLVSRLIIRGPFPHLPLGIILLDVPGTDDGYFSMEERARTSIDSCDAVYLVTLLTKLITKKTYNTLLQFQFHQCFGIIVSKADIDFEADKINDQFAGEKKDFFEKAEKEYKIKKSISLYILNNKKSETQSKEWQDLRNQFITKELKSPQELYLSTHEIQLKHFTLSLLNFNKLNTPYQNQQRESFVEIKDLKSDLDNVLNTFRTEYLKCLKTLNISQQLTTYMYHTIRANIRDGYAFYFVLNCLHMDPLVNLSFETVLDQLDLILEQTKNENLKHLIEQKLELIKLQFQTKFMQWKQSLKNIILKQLSSKSLFEKTGYQVGTGVREWYLEQMKEWLQKNCEKIVDNTIKSVKETFDELISELIKEVNNTMRDLFLISNPQQVDKDLKEKIVSIFNRYIDIEESDYFKYSNEEKSPDTIDQPIIPSSVNSLDTIHNLDPSLTALPKVWLERIQFQTYYFLGYVYVLTNPSFPNLYKIGYSELLPEYRAKKLFTTGVPTPFQVCCYWKTRNMKLLERVMHLLLKSHREYPKREFFRVAYDLIIQIGDCAQILLDRLPQAYRTDYLEN